MSLRASSLLSLPPELRDLIYDFVAPNHVAAFADLPDAHFRRPSLLAVNRQIGHGYASVFFQRIIIDSWWSSTGSWCSIQGTTAKKAIFLTGAFADLSCNHYDVANGVDKRSKQK